jgi:hypothetical protein
MREVHVVWVAIGLLVLTLLFPPYGYTQYTVNVVSDGIRIPPQTAVVPWTYVGHRFILSRPPGGDRELTEVFNQQGPKGVSFVRIDNMAVAWPVIGAEALLICLVAAALIYTLRRRAVN